MTLVEKEQWIERYNNKSRLLGQEQFKIELIENKIVITKCNGIKMGIVKIPNGVEVIGKEVFSYSDIRELIIADSVEYINSYAFFMCRKLETINISNNIKVIGYSAFNRCGDLRNVNLSYGIEYIGEKAFIRTDLDYIDIPKSIKSIGDNCFDECRYLVKVRIPKELDINEKKVFSKCSSLDYIERY